MSQIDKLRSWINGGHTITSNGARKRWSMNNLPSRIGQLENEGFIIIRKKVVIRHKDGSIERCLQYKQGR